jgi:Lon protease-like protein
MAEAPRPRVDGVPIGIRERGPNHRGCQARMAKADPSIISLFPLASVVLFPSLTVPLYIFEPRYRQMVEQSIAEGQRIGMVAVRPEGVDAMGGDPPLFEIGCAGEVSQSRRRDDGSWDILLRAVGRFRIVEEMARPEGQLYRSARVEMLDDPNDAADARSIAPLRKQVLSQLGELLRRADPENDRRPNTEQLARITDDEQLVNSLAQGLDFGLLEKQRLLEADSIADRYDALSELMRFRLAELSTPGGPGSGLLQ